MTSGDGEPEARGRRAPPNARTLAARVLERVHRDGAFAAAALDAEMERLPEFDPRDRALATEIVYGVLRTEAALRELVSAHATRGLPKDPVVVSHLLVAAYQLAFLDRVPAHAVVDAAVTAVSAARGRRVSGFVNALLRKVAAGPRPERGAAIRRSAPPWLLRALVRDVGEEEADALLGVSEGELRTAVRVVSGKEAPEWLASAGRGRVSPRARLVPRGGDLRKRQGYREGAFVLQEEGAQAVALALGARPGERVLDACAGRGQKTTLLRECIGPAGELVATDLYPDKLGQLARELERLSLAPVTTLAVDWTVGDGGLRPGFDRVLVDAPCTGTGTLRHRPEIARRLGPEDPARVARTAEAIFRRAGGLARPGGRVVFAVCSVLREECEDVVASVSDVFEPAPFDAPELVSVIAPGATSFRLGPSRHGTDGFFVASFVRR
ncbi:MAG TPA: transcription antitermination factor NusB [Polyangiaceae bacterium]|nr:transcription antitermination factor NusB [Polyangiaceae bacterium]